jgi:hypothetical protein
MEFYLAIVLVTMLAVHLGSTIKIVSIERATVNDALLSFVKETRKTLGNQYDWEEFVKEMNKTSYIKHFILRAFVPWKDYKTFYPADLRPYISI